MSENYKIINHTAIDFKIVGTSFRNQNLLQNIHNKLQTSSIHNVKLEFEKDNKYDPNAIKILVNDQHIGYIPKELCQRLKKLLLTYKIVTRTCYLRCNCKNKMNDSYHVIFGFKKKAIL